MVSREVFIKNVADKAGFCIKDVRELLEAFEDEVLYIMRSEDEIRFRFGLLGGKHMYPREHVNPKGKGTIMSREKFGFPYYKAPLTLKGYAYGEDKVKIEEAMKRVRERMEKEGKRYESEINKDL